MGILDNIVLIAIVGGGAYLIYMYKFGGGMCSGFLGKSPICIGMGAWDFFSQQYDTGDAGVPFALEKCQDGWTSEPLTCREPLGCCSDSRDAFGHCWAWNVCGGHVVGRLNNQQCPSSHPDKIGLLCYRQCPKGWIHTEAMPYLC